MKVKLTVELREDGKVYVSGPLDQKQLCLDMLIEAMQAVKNHKKHRIVTPSINDLKKLN